MAYVSIYRKYRPFDFDGIVGQEHIVRILRNQIKNGNIGHAYLFTGTRGTGKTSIAKIFARAINCVDNAGGSACGKCSVCLEMSKPSNLDIIEIDAASNNGVDEIRELREAVKYPPAYGKYKVYIIDEVHMLSVGAFNALLKTLEEPPAHVVFILATTEVHKLPQTILSRCLRLDFRLVPAEQIAKRIEFIFKDMGVTYSTDAVKAIAEAGDGSVRDALSIADTCVSFGEGNIDYDSVLEVLGASNPSVIVDIIESILRCDIGTSLKIIDEVAYYGKSMNLLARDLAKMFRNLFIAINCENSEKLLSLPQEIVTRLKGMTDVGSERILKCVDIMSGIESGMRYSSLPRVMVETAVAKACSSETGIDTVSLITRIKNLENKINSIGNVNITPVGNTAAVINQKSKRPFSASAVYGYLVKSLREKKLYGLYSELTELDMKNFKLIGTELVISPSVQSTGSTLLNQKYYEIIKELICNEFDGVENIKIVMPEQERNIENDIETVKNLFDSDIIKTKN